MRTPLLGRAPARSLLRRPIDLTPGSPVSAADQDLTKYRTGVWERHKNWFEFHHEVAAALEAAVKQPRTYPTHVHLVLEMLMLQGLKSHAAVSLLAQHGLMEDAASATRRLMELAIQAGYIGLESDEKERRRRAGRLAAFMWRRVPDRFKRRLPDEVRKMWVGLGRGYGRYVPANARRWGPTFFDMFVELGQEELYRQDYSFLSGLAHGTSDHQVFQFATMPFRIHRDDHASVLLRYSSRYYLALAYAWNKAFDVLAETDFDEFTERMNRLADGGSPAGAP